jgi:hypothetical protein
LHPSIDSGDITIITDQDKGQKNAITHYLKSVGHFHCSYHRRQNIIKMCGGGGGKLPNSALWMYNKLMKCKNVEQLQYNKDKHSSTCPTRTSIISIPWMMSHSIRRLDALWASLCTCIFVHRQV